MKGFAVRVRGISENSRRQNFVFLPTKWLLLLGFLQPFCTKTVIVTRAPAFLCVNIGGYGWVGHIYAQKCRGPGTKGFGFIYFLPPGLRPTQKVPGTPARCQAGQFPHRLGVTAFTKEFLIGSTNRVRPRRHLPIQKPNFRGRAIQEPVFPAAKTDFEGGVDGRGCFG